MKRFYHIVTAIITKGIINRVFWFRMCRSQRHMISIKTICNNDNRTASVILHDFLKRAVLLSIIQNKQKQSQPLFENPVISKIMLLSFYFNISFVKAPFIRAQVSLLQKKVSNGSEKKSKITNPTINRNVRNTNQHMFVS